MLWPDLAAGNVCVAGMWRGCCARESCSSRKVVKSIWGSQGAAAAGRGDICTCAFCARGKQIQILKRCPSMPLASSPQPSAKYSLGNQQQLPPSCGRSAPGGDQPRVPNHSAKLGVKVCSTAVKTSLFHKYFFGQEKNT